MGLSIFGRPSAAALNFTSSLTGGVQRSLQAKLEDFVSVKDFGATGDGTTDDTLAIQAALDTHRHVYIPAGVYKIISTLNCTTVGQIIRGEGIGVSGLGGTIIQQVTSGQGGFSFLANSGGNLSPDGAGIYYFCLEDMKIETTQTGTGVGLRVGNDATFSGDWCLFTNLCFNGFATGMHFKSMAQIRMLQVTVTGTDSARGLYGLYVEGGSSNSWDLVGFGAAHQTFGIYLATATVGFRLRGGDFGANGTHIFLAAAGASIQVEGANFESYTNLTLTSGSSINTSTDVITSASHNLFTGDAVSVKTSGTFPTSSPSLTVASLVFVRRIDANTFTLHSTSAGASANTGKIDFTANTWTGTLNIGGHVICCGTNNTHFSVAGSGTTGSYALEPIFTASSNSTGVLFDNRMSNTGGAVVRGDGVLSLSVGVYNTFRGGTYDETYLQGVFPAVFDNGLPSASSSNRGAVYQVIGRSGTAADGLYLSRRKADGSTHEMAPVDCYTFRDQVNTWAQQQTFGDGASSGGVKIAQAITGSTGDERGALVIARDTADASSASVLIRAYTWASNEVDVVGRNAAGTSTVAFSIGGSGYTKFKGDLRVDATITAGGTTGAQTISKNAGSVNFAASAQTLVVTNTRVTTSSVIVATVATDDATALNCKAIPANGSFTLKLNATATAETRVNWVVLN